MLSCVYHHFPTTGKSPGWPNGPMQASTPHASSLPFPFRSRYHIDVLGRKTPILTFPVPSQSPTIGMSPLVPNWPRHLSLLHPSHFSFPLRSRYQVPSFEVKSAICSMPVPFQSPTTGISPTTLNVSH